MALQIAGTATNTFLSAPFNSLPIGISKAWDSFGLEDVAIGVAGIYLILAGILAVSLILSYSVALVSTLSCPLPLPGSSTSLQGQGYCSNFRDYETEVYGFLLLGTVVGGPFIPLHLMLYDGIQKREYSKIALWEKIMVPVTVTHGFINILWRGIDGGFIFNLFALGVVHIYKERLHLNSGNSSEVLSSMLNTRVGNLSSLAGLPSGVLNITGPLAGQMQNTAANLPLAGPMLNSTSSQLLAVGSTPPVSNLTASIPLIGQGIANGKIENTTLTLPVANLVKNVAAGTNSVDPSAMLQQPGKFLGALVS